MTIPLSRFLVLSSYLLPTLQKGFDDSVLSLVRSNLLTSAARSWEIGTAAEALTEFSWPALSVFSSSAFPPVPPSNVSLNVSDVLGLVNAVLSQKPADSAPFWPDEGSAADPASLGGAVLLANWTRLNMRDERYANAASAQLFYLLNNVSRSRAGAISHRNDQVQLWADSVYMVPPFIAYYGALQGGTIGVSLMNLAYEQCSLYRDALRDSSGLWRHVALGDWQDDSHWGTGNAWAAAGMLRVFQTLNHSSQANRVSNQQLDLLSWIHEITSTVWQFQGVDGALNNVIDDPTAFDDASSTALLAAVTYRMATITKDTSLVSSASSALTMVQRNIDVDGWLINAVNPYSFKAALRDGQHTPEGQAFVLLLDAAWRQYEKAFHVETNSEISVDGLNLDLDLTSTNLVS